MDPETWCGSVGGILGVLYRGGRGKSAVLDEMSDDYSRRMSESVVQSVRRLCTSSSGELDQSSFDTICQKVRMGVADGAASVQKALEFLASGRFPGMLACVRDMSHKVRIATGDPLLADDRFSAWWDDVFGERHALVPDIQNSDAWAEKLELCQKVLLEADEGVRECGCVTVQRTMSFAKQRFDSYASPQMKFCVLFVALAMLLAYQASDPRVKSEVRARASRRLEQMPHYVLPAGLSATYSAEALEFVRIFDTVDHDPALSWSQAREWRRRMDILFVEGHVWACGSEVDGAEKTPLGIIWQQARSAKPIFYGNKVVHLFSRASPEHRRSLLDSIQHVIKHMGDRMDVDFDIRRPEIALTAMDINRWDHCLQERRAGRHDPMALLQSHARTMFGHWQLDAGRGVRELEGCAILLLRQERERRKAKTYLDNRVLWARTLEASFLKDVSSFGRMHVLPDMVVIYLAAMDGTGNVERNLGSLLQVLEAHSGPLSEDGEVAAALTELLVDGPLDESGLAIRPDACGSVGVGSDGVQDVDILLQPTDLTREFALEWVEANGRRFRVYAPSTVRPKAEARKQPPKKGSMARVMFDSKASRDLLVKRATTASATPDELTFLGVPRAEMMTRNDQAAPGTKLHKFALTTALRRTQLNSLSASREVARKRRVNPYSLDSDNPAKRLRVGKKIQWRVGVRELEPSRADARFRVLDTCVQEQRPLQGVSRYVLVRAPAESRGLVHAIQRADIVLCDNVWGLDRQTADASQRILEIMFPAIALGKAVLHRIHWIGTAPHLSNSLLRFSRAVVQEKVTLVLGAEFRRKYPGLCQIIKDSTDVKGSKWVVTDIAPKTEADAVGVAKAKPKFKPKAKAKAKAKPMEVVRLSSREDLRAFLQKYRRFARSGGVSSEYFRPSRMGRFKVGKVG